MCNYVQQQYTTYSTMAALYVTPDQTEYNGNMHADQHWCRISVLCGGIYSKENNLLPSASQLMFW